MRRFAIVLGGLAAVGIVIAAVSWRNAVEAPTPHPEILPPSIGAPDWRETRRYSVNRVLVVEGECGSRDRAEEIARSIVGKSPAAYDEILVYVRTRDQKTTRRVLWRPATGYHVLDF